MLNTFEKNIGSLLLLIFCASMQAEEAPSLTGPLIAPVGQAVPYGHFLLKNYLAANVETGRYDYLEPATPSEKNFYSLSYQGDYYFGITPWADCNLVPRLIYNYTASQQSVSVGDFSLGLDIQLLDAHQTPYFPGIKLAIRENFPTGRYEYLTPKKWGSDQTGTGTYATQFELVLYKLFHLYDLHWLSLTVSTDYTINTPVTVHDFNAYGGGFGAKGVVLPGDRFRALVSFELTLNERFSFALDNVYTFTETSRFYGFEGIAFDGSLAKIGKSFSSQWNFAPSLEINFSSHFGIIAGCYFSALEHNAPTFRSAVCNFNYLY